MRSTSLALVIVAGLAASSTGLISTAHAQSATCAADLSALDAEIQTPSLRAGLQVPFSEVIDNAGGLDEALTNTRALLEQLSMRRAGMPDDVSPEAIKPLDEAILIMSSTVEALECRKASTE